MKNEIIFFENQNIKLEVNNKRLVYLEKTINLIDIANRLYDNLKGNEVRI